MSAPCRCRDETVRFLSVECPEHAKDAHTAWNTNWIATHPRYRVEQAPRYPVGTFHVKPHCLCLGNHPYLSIKCPEKATHRRWQDYPR